MSAKRLIQYAFDELQMNRIQLKAAIGNIKSQQIAIRLGFTYEGTERAGELHEHGFVDLMQFGLLPERKTVLIVGGSLGANSINDAILKNLSSFSEQQIQLIWQTGKSQATRYANAAKSFSNVYVNSFLESIS